MLHLEKKKLIGNSLVLEDVYCLKENTVKGSERQCMVVELKM